MRVLIDLGRPFATSRNPTGEKCFLETLLPSTSQYLNPFPRPPHLFQGSMLVSPSQYQLRHSCESHTSATDTPVNHTQANRHACESHTSATDTPANHIQANRHACESHTSATDAPANHIQANRHACESHTRATDTPVNHTQANRHACESHTSKQTRL